jgi:hypothetical protein
VKCIAELITVNLEQNIDFNDINSILKNSGSAMLGIAEANGDDRIDDVIKSVLICPLLTEANITNAKNFLFSISYGTEKKLKISELQQLTDYFEKIHSNNSHVIWGRNEDPSLDDKIKLSVIVSNYSTGHQKEHNTIFDLTSIFNGEQQPGAELINRGSNIFNPVDDVDFKTPTKEINGLEFLHRNDTVDNFSKVAEPELAEVDAGFTTGPQMLKRNYDPTYEDDNKFSYLIDKPAVLRERENKEDFQDKAVQDNFAPSFKINNPELDAFFRDLPD